MEHLYNLTRAFYQQGIILVVTLLFLLTTSLLALSLLESSLLQTRMSHNFYNKSVAFQAAESALKLAEAAILSAQTSGKASAMNSGYIFNPYTTGYCENKNCFLITASGHSASAINIIKEIYVLESKHLGYPFIWWEE